MDLALETAVRTGVATSNEDLSDYMRAGFSPEYGVIEEKSVYLEYKDGFFLACALGGAVIGKIGNAPHALNLYRGLLKKRDARGGFMYNGMTACAFLLQISRQQAERIDDLHRNQGCSAMQISRILWDDY